MVKAAAAAAAAATVVGVEEQGAEVVVDGVAISITISSAITSRASNRIKVGDEEGVEVPLREWDAGGGSLAKAFPEVATVEEEERGVEGIGPLPLPRLRLLLLLLLLVLLQLSQRGLLILVLCMFGFQEVAMEVSPVSATSSSSLASTSFQEIAMEVSPVSAASSSLLASTSSSGSGTSCFLSEGLKWSSNLLCYR